MVIAESQEARNRAAAVIGEGGVIAFRTDTFYGLGADPLNPLAIRAVRKLKGREEAKPILVLISDQREVERFIDQRSEVFEAVARVHWPGPITLVGIARPGLPKELTAGSGTIGLRLPDDEGVRILVRACGGAITASSANPSGRLPARTAKDVQAYFPEGIDLIIDAGKVNVTQPSTVLDLSGPEPQLIRQGIISREELRQWL